MTQLIFNKRPWFAEYQKMRELAMQIGNWEAVRYALAPKIALTAAERGEEAYPRASIDLYQHYVERLIKEHGRSNYQVACSYLVKIRSLYEKLDETGQWILYIALLRKRQSRLRTLKEELAAVGL